MKLLLQGLSQKVTFPTRIGLEAFNDAGPSPLYLELLENQEALYNLIGFFE